MRDKLCLLDHAHRTGKSMAVPARHLIHSRKTEGEQGEI